MLERMSVTERVHIVEKEHVTHTHTDNQKEQVKKRTWQREMFECEKGFRARDMLEGIVNMKYS